MGLAAWILDHDKESYELLARVFDGQEEGLTRDDILDNITLYWPHRNCGVVGPALLGEQITLLPDTGREGPCRGERLPDRALSGA